MALLNIDDDENVDWLHRVITRFLVFKNGKDVGMLDLKDERIRTQDERLKELFYVYLDEGIDGEEVKPDADGSARMQAAFSLEGYELRPDEENTQAEDALVKHTKEEVQYEDPAKGMDHCRDCKHFDSTAKKCAVVAGDIAPGAWCKEFSRVTVFDYQGLKIHAEQLRGDVRHGETFHQKMTAPYGYIRKTEGADGDAVDCFLGPLANAPFVYVIHTRNRGGSYDEDKCMLGFENALSAQQVFLENYDSPTFFDSMEKFSIADFKNKLRTLRGKKITATDAIELTGNERQDTGKLLEYRSFSEEASGEDWTEYSRKDYSYGKNSGRKWESLDEKERGRWGRVSFKGDKVESVTICGDGKKRVVKGWEGVQALSSAYGD